jgi:hypothetical protein
MASGLMVVSNLNLYEYIPHSFFWAAPPSRSISLSGFNSIDDDDDRPGRLAAGLE